MEGTMAAIVKTIEIARPPEDVFAYIDALERHSEWQEQLVTSTTITPGPTHVGTRATDHRHVPGVGTVDQTYEIVEHDPPHRSRFETLNGPIRPVGTITVEPVDDGSRSRVTVELDVQGHHVGRLLAPLIRRQASKQVPKDQLHLKELLEANARNS
jgi:uncharacterized membrane protein